MLSIDVAHAFHPNYVDKCDITNRPSLAGDWLSNRHAVSPMQVMRRRFAVIKGLC